MFILRTLFAASYNKQIEFQPLVVLELRNRIDPPMEQDTGFDLFCRRIVATQRTSCQIENKEQPMSLYSTNKIGLSMLFFSFNNSKSKTEKNPCPQISETITGCPWFASILFYFILFLFFCCYCVGFASISGVTLYLIFFGSYPSAGSQGRCIENDGQLP